MFQLENVYPGLDWNVQTHTLWGKHYTTVPPSRYVYGVAADTYLTISMDTA